MSQENHLPPLDFKPKRGMSTPTPNFNFIHNSIFNLQFYLICVSARLIYLVPLALSGFFRTKKDTFHDQYH